MNIQLSDLWTAAGILLGFQVTSFAARVNREISIGEKERITWLPPADIVNLFSMFVLVIGIYILPVLGFANQKFITYAFGLAVLLFIGYPFALAAHYDMYNRKTKRSFEYFPYQEKVVVITIAILAIAYVVIALIKR
ncbi:hypothetical protein [Ktedonospora formicarum]|uniref:Uncharacterized protein n=1 Tax=Ktedonospora formicarum TaxID=2778364 RepID=A0A8J3IHQ7_9CHLR|nr:hypothetical protein [Ktedonospora formicarum]GHO51369.1 hypothetical protein KSX_95320 [Ktedonospora formicarum]